MGDQDHALNPQSDAQALDVIGLSPKRRTLRRVGHGSLSNTSQVRNDQTVPLAKPGQVTEVAGVTRSSSGEDDDRFRLATNPRAGHIIVVK